MNLLFIDWLIIAVVLLGMIYSVSFTKGLMKSVTDFLSAGRTAGRYLISVSQGAAGLGAISIVSFLEVGYITGFSFQWWGLSQGIIILAITASGWVIYRFRQTRSLTLAQFFEKRYSRKFRIFAGIVAFVCGIINFGIFPAVGAQFFISYCGFPDSFIGIPTFPLVMIILISIALYFVYTGGQIAVIIADFFQGVFLIVVLFVITIFLYKNVGWDQVTDSLKNTPKKLAVEEVQKLKEENSFKLLSEDEQLEKIEETTDHWLGILQPADIWCAEVLEWDKMIENEGFKVLDMFQRIKRSDGLNIETLRCPIRINSQIFKSEIAAPLVGQHNNEIIEEYQL